MNETKINNILNLIKELENTTNDENADLCFRASKVIKELLENRNTNLSFRSRSKESLTESDLA